MVRVYNTTKEYYVMNIKKISTDFTKYKINGKIEMKFTDTSIQSSGNNSYILF